MRKVERRVSTDTLLIAVAFSVGLSGQSVAFSQDAAPVSIPGTTNINDTPPVNPLQGLFQMQPQYPTPGTTQMFPEAVPAHMGSDSSVPGRNPGQTSTIYQPGFKDTEAKEPPKIERTDNGIKGLFQMQPQYPTPGTTQMFPEAVPKHLGDDSSVQGRNPGQNAPTFQSQWKDPGAPEQKKSEDKTDYLKNLFQMQPQFATPGTTVMFPEPTSPQFGPDGDKPGQQPGQTAAKFETPVPTAEVTLPPAAGEKSEEGEKKTEAKEGDKKDEKKEEGKEGDKKDEKDAKDEKKEEGKEGEKKDEKDEKADAKDEKKDEKKDAKADAKDTKKDEKKDEKKEGDKKADAKDGDKTEKKEEVKYLPYHPLRESISLMQANRLAESESLLTRELKKDPKNAQAVYIRATVYVRMRQYEKAATDYREVLKLSPTGDLAAKAKAGLTKLHF